jgi:hypothetical protein
MSEPVDSERLLSPTEVARWMTERGFTISRQRVNEQLIAGNLPGYRVGSRWVTPLPWLRRWLEGPAVPEFQIGPKPVQFLARRAS